MNITIFKGFHFSLPPLFRSGRNIAWTYECSIDSSYKLNSVDQEDTNKLIGIKQDYFKPMNNSVMVGWFWNIATQKNNLRFYSHKNGIRNIGDVLTTVDLKEKFLVSFTTKIDKVVVTLKVRGINYMNVFTYSESIWFLINTWFGGNNPASTTMNFTINKIK